MNMQEGKLLLEGFLPDIEWFSAGKLAYQDTENGRKKIMVRPHKDGQAITKDTNVLKAQLNNKYLVIDADSADLDELANIYPSILKTFATRTTNTHKRHFYFKPIKGLKGVRKIGLEASGEYDILSTGIIFEAHSIPTQPEEWVIINDNEVIALTEDEIDIVKLVTKDSVTNSYSNGTSNFFKDTATASIVGGVVEAGKLPEDNKTHKQLMFGIHTKEYRKEFAKSRKRVPMPKFDHAMFNGVCFKLSFNNSIAHEVRDKFVNILLKDGYGIDPDSTQTYTHLQKSIYATLPRHDSVEDVLLSDSFKDSLQFTLSNGTYAVSYVNANGSLNYMLLDEHSLKPRVIGHNSGIKLDERTLISIKKFGKEEMSDIPRVILIDDPFLPYITFDDIDNVSVLNISQQSEYYEKATEVPTRPNNVLTRLIYSYFGDTYQDFYYHWLAHLMYNSRPPQTMPMLVSLPQDDGATGKSTLAQALPARLVRATATADISSTDNAWGDLTLGRKLISFNDMKQMNRVKWEPAYAFCKDNTTAGTMKLHNMKGSGIVMSDSVTAFSFSANWMPPLDQHDRRLWIVMPQMLYGNTKLLTKVDGDKLNEIIEHSSLKEYHDEFQELANYLKYLFSNHKDEFATELYQVAPITEYREVAISQQRNISETIISDLKKSPEALENSIGSEQMVFISKFIIFQYSVESGNTYLPTSFLSKLLNLSKKDDREVKYTNKRIESALGLADGSFKNRGELHAKFKHKSNLGMFDEFEQNDLLEYVKTQCVIEIPPLTIEKYKKYITENQSLDTL